MQPDRPAIRVSRNGLLRVELRCAYSTRFTTFTNIPVIRRAGFNPPLPAHTDAAKIPQCIVSLKS